MKPLPVLAVLIVLAPLALGAPATIISDVTFESSGLIPGSPSSFIIPNQYHAATMHFTASPGYDLVEISLGTLNNRGEIRQFDISTCPSQRCAVPIGLFVSSGGVTHTAQYTITAINGDTQSLQSRFALDTVPPRLVSIGTPTCTPSTATPCAVRSGTSVVTIRFTETGSGMIRNSVSLTVNDASATLASSCSKTECNVSVPIGAQSGSVRLALRPVAQDATGNRVDAASLREYAFMIDNAVPTIIDTAISRQGQDDLSIVTGTFDLTVRATDTSPITVTTNLGVITNGTKNVTAIPCDQDGECTLRISPKTGSYTTRLNITVTDAAGNTVTTQQEVRVARLADGGADLELWEANPNVQPNTINRGTALLFPRVIHVPLNLDGERGAKPVYTRVSNCGLYAGTERQISGTASVLGASTERPVVAVKFPPMELANAPAQLDLRCTVRITTALREVVYKEEQELNISERIYLTDSPLLATNIETIQESSEKRLDETMTQLQQYRALYQIGGTLCTAMESIKIAQSTMSQAQAASTLGGTLDVLGAPMRAADSALGRAGNAILDNQFGGVLCGALTCEYADGLNDLVNSMDAFSDETAFGRTTRTIYGVTTGSTSVQYFDPYKSFPIAYATACIPAIIKHQDTQAAIQCAYNQCLQTDIFNGIPVSACAAQQSQLECRYVAGGLYNAAGFTNVYQTIRDSVLNLVSNPVAAFGYAISASCDFLPSNFANAVCKIPDRIDDVYTATTAVVQLKDAVTLVSTYNAAGTTCQASQQRIVDFRDALASRGTCTDSYCCADGHCIINKQCYEIRSTEASRTPFNQTAGEDAVGRIVRVQTGQSLRAVDGTCPRAVRDLAEYAGVDETFATRELTEKLNDAANAVQDQTIVSQNARRASQEFREHLTAGGLQASFDVLLFQQELAESRNLDPNDATSYLPPDIAARTPEQVKATVPQYLAMLQTYRTSVPSEEQAAFDAQFQELESALAQADNPEAIFTAIRNAEVTATIRTALDETADTQQEKLKKIEEDFLDAQEKAYEEARQNLRRTNTRVALTDAARAALQLRSLVTTASGIVSHFGVNVPDVIQDGWFDPQTSGIGQVSDLEAQFLDAVCSAKWERDPGIIAVGSDQRVGLYLHATRSIAPIDDINAYLEDEDADEEFLYLVGGSLSIPKAEDDQDGAVSYRIYLQGSSETLAEGELNRGQLKSWRATEALRYNTTRTFQEVCITLSEPVEDLFQTTMESGKTLCVPVQAVNG